MRQEEPMPAAAANDESPFSSPEPAEKRVAHSQKFDSTTPDDIIYLCTIGIDFSSLIPPPNPLPGKAPPMDESASRILKMKQLPYTLRG